MQQLRVPGDMAKRRAQVVGHRVGKRFQFLVARLELRSPLLKLPVDQRQLARCLDALANVARDLGETDQLAALIFKCVDHHVGQEAAAVLAHAQSFGFKPTIASGDFKGLLRRIRLTVLLCVEAREVLADNLLGAVAFDALCAPVPAG